MSAADIAVVGATALAAVFLLPQTVRLARTGDAAGVSATWPALGAVTNVGWFAYLLSRRLWLSAPSTVFMVVFYSTILFYLRRSGRGLQAPIRRGGVWAAILLAVLAGGGWPALGVVLGSSYVVQMAPPVWSAYRTRAPSGIAAGTWWIGGVESLLWGFYGWSYGDLPIVIFAVVAATASVLMLSRFYATRRRWQEAPVAA